jgi:imidazole glycerol-phosphate synthase subunit HisH
MIVIVNYGLGNLGSIFNMFKKLKVECKISSDPDEIVKAQKILLPGVGAFDNAMKKIEDLNLKEILISKALIEKVPFLGICLGMQILTDSSEEGEMPGFGWIKGKTKKFIFDKNSILKVPHMGWNTITITRESPLSKNLPDEPKFYFVHSYYVCLDDENNSMFKTNHGLTFDSAIQKDNIFGAQFHPEKSHKYGMKFLENFASI